VDSPIERYHDRFYVQKLQVSNEFAGVDRLEVFRRFCEGKRVLHIGCVDHPLFDLHKNLHLQLEKYCAVLDGFDVNSESFEQMRPFLKGKLLSKWEDICDAYDLVLVPEVMEHVPNVRDFLGQIARIRTSQVIITVPDAFQCFSRHFDYNQHTNTFVEVVHPDHKCWYTPYTLLNTIKQYTDWAIEGLYFVNGISVMAVATVRQRAAKVVQGIEAASAGRPKVLLACDYYWPSNGGVETICLNLGKSLQQCGYEVEIATRSLPERRANVHCGMAIHSLDTSMHTVDGLPIAARQLRGLIESGRYAAVIIRADPLTWPIWSTEGAQVPSHTRILVQPLINEDGYARWRDNRQFRDRLAAVLRRATFIVSLTHNGPDARFLDSERIPFVSIPNATMPEDTTTDFRRVYGFEQGRPLVIHVANLWRVKNQIGLIQSFRNKRLDLQIALIGNPAGDKAYESAVRAEVSKDPRFTLLTGLHGEKIAAAMKAADLVVLPSFGEVFPVSLLEAMSHGKAWLATPQCGAANELAGGVIAPLEQFPAIIERLLANRDLLTRLGLLGQRHWETCFQWPQVASMWHKLIAHGAPPASWLPGNDLWNETMTIRRYILNDQDGASIAGGLSSATQQWEQRGNAEKEGLLCGAKEHCDLADIREDSIAPNQIASLSRHRTSATEETTSPLVSVIIPTYNRPESLVHAIKSVLDQTYRPIEIIVVNDGGDDVEAIVSSLNRDQRCIVYVKHAANKGLAAARNTGLALARGRYVAYLDDDDRFYPEHVETLVAFLEQSEYRVAYSDAYRVHVVKEGDRSVVLGKDLPYSYDFNASALLVGNYFPVLTVMHERTCLDQCGMFDETLTTHEDWDLWIRMSRWYPFAHVKRITAEFVWRTDGSTITSRMQEDFVRTTEIIYRKYRAHAESIPGVLEAQAEHLAMLKASVAAPVHASKPTFACSIIIPVWNQVELTRQCLHALAAATGGIEYEVIIVDNGSTDETPALLASLGGDVQIIRNDENLGFAKACNQGARAARGRYLVFLNNDTIPQEGWLQALVKEAQAYPNVAVVGSKLLYPDGTVQHAGVAFARANSLPYHHLSWCTRQCNGRQSAT